MATATWKANERRLAQALGGTRLGATGASNPDVTTPTLCIEAKHRKRLPEWLTEPLTLVRKHARGTGKTGIVVWHAQGQRTTSSLVVMSLGDFQALTGQAESTICESATAE